MQRSNIPIMYCQERYSSDAQAGQNLWKYVSVLVRVVSMAEIQERLSAILLG